MGTGSEPTLHVYCLAAPDYLGYESVLAMANEELLPVVKQALSLKRLGNDISVLIRVMRSRTGPL